MGPTLSSSVSITKGLLFPNKLQSWLWFMATKWWLLSCTLCFRYLSTPLGCLGIHVHAKEGYAALASLSCKLGHRLYRIRPKLHMLVHVVCPALIFKYTWMMPSPLPTCKCDYLGETWTKSWSQEPHSSWIQFVAWQVCRFFGNHLYFMLSPTS